MKTIYAAAFASSSDKQPWWKKSLKSLAPLVFVASGFLTVSVQQASVALVITHPNCTWPADWPKALDEVRNSCRTIECAAGNQENIYEIVFDDRETFEKLWPVLLTLKTPGAPLRLFKAGSPSTISLLSNAKPTVRIFGPAYNAVTIAPSEAGKEHWDVGPLLAESEALHPTPPWPAKIVGANGELPEYVQAVEENGRMTWVPADRDCCDCGFLNRARVDLELVADGSVIDLNRTQLPSDGTIIDRRFDGKPETERGESSLHPIETITLRLVSFKPALDPDLIAEARRVISRAQTHMGQVFDYRDDPTKPKVRLVPAGDLDKNE